MGRARRARVALLYDGQDTKLSEKVLSIAYTDNAEGRSDDVRITLEDRDLKWLEGKAALPEQGHEVDLTILLEHWESNSDMQSYHVGKFVIDDITINQDAACTVTIGAVSMPADEGFNSVPRSESWSNVTLKQLAQEIMARYGMEKLFWYGEETVLEAVEQENESDSAFLKRLCDKQGLCLKVYKTGLVIFSKKVYEGRGFKYLFTRFGIERFSYNKTLCGTYTGAELKYTQSGGKDSEPKTISVKVGTEERMLKINQSVKDEEEARKLAIARVNEANEKAETINLTVFPQTILYASDNFLIDRVGVIDGKYFTQSVTHNISGGRYSCNVTGYKVFNRL
nr:MAG TPA: tail protein [Caudoviricetes sp.]